MATCDLSIVIVSSKRDYVLDCLSSVRNAIKQIRSEIILVDNASTDDVGKVAKEKNPEIRVIRRQENGGFGENNNLGMKVANGRYVLLLNDDTKITNKNIFVEMIKWMDEHPDVGISSCALVNSDGVSIQGSGGYFPTLLRVFAWMTFLDDIPGVDTLIKPYHPMHPESILSKNEKYFTKPHKQDWVTGAFFMMRKKAMDEVGLFDNEFFLYVEEVDLAYRFAKKGWETWYLPNWKTIHFGMSTSGSERATIYEMKNLKLFYKKHFPSWQLPMVSLILKVGIILRIVIFGILGRPVAKTYVKAFIEV